MTASGVADMSFGEPPNAIYNTGTYPNATYNNGGYPSANGGDMYVPLP
jgi:hypothetical protein